MAKKKNEKKSIYESSSESDDESDDGVFEETSKPSVFVRKTSTPQRVAPLSGSNPSSKERKEREAPTSAYAKRPSGQQVAAEDDFDNFVSSRSATVLSLPFSLS